MTSVPTPRTEMRAQAQAGAGRGWRGAVDGAAARLRALAAQPAIRRALPSIAVIAAVAVAALAWLALRETPRTALYPGLPDAEKAAVLTALAASGIGAEVDAATGEVTVPAGDFHRARLALAAQGLPESAPDADRILTDLPMGASRALETARLRQAREIELARTITEIAGVQSARVHLALPERSAFLRDSQPPSASVFLSLADGRALGEGQIAAIVHLVSAAVPGMARSAVAVIDQTGRLLTEGDGSDEARLSDRQLRYRVELETLLRQRIEAVLAPVVGVGNLSVQVTAALDFTQREEREERVDPEARAVLSEQLRDSETRNRPPGGIPGAVANTPPAEPQLTEAPPEQQAQRDGGVQTRSSEATRNFEVSRTVTSTRPEVGQILRISAAVAIRAPEGDAGGAGAAGRITPELLADLQRLAESAIGMDASRGDSVTVVVQPFAAAALPEVTASAIPDWLPGLARDLVLAGLLAAIALGVLRPLLLRRLPAPVAATATTVEVAEGETLDDLSARLDRRQKELAASVVGARATRAQKQAVLRQIAAEDPARTAAVLHRMMKSDLDKVS